ncbi:MAG: DUF2283 domain-containing protein [Magnetococcales bacterium]|nr:DUF2283 domain-containing protein [Magnetococcales bacterium]
MHVRVDSRSDAIYLDLTHEAVDSSEEVADGIILDYDVQGRLVGIEIIGASKKAKDESIWRNLTMEMVQMA